MSNIDSAKALFSAINRDRVAEIEGLHNPDVVFSTFRGPTLRGSGAVGDWHQEFLRMYADCEYTEVEYIEQGNVVSARATIVAKGYDWREFSQRVVEVLDFEDGGISGRRVYAMPPDVEFTKPAADQLKNAAGFRGASPATTLRVATTFFQSLIGGDIDTAKAYLDPRAVLVDGVYGTAVGPDNVVALIASQPVPAFGSWRVERAVGGPKDAVVETAIAPRPRAATWVRVVDEKIVLLEVHWMLREIGFDPAVSNRERPGKQVIMPI